MAEPKNYIGGSFELDQNLSTWMNFGDYFGLKDNHKYFASGRSAFAYILEQTNLKGRKVLMPDYCCWESLGPVLKHDYEVYKVKPDMTMDFSSVSADLIGAVLFINYFGMMKFDQKELRLRFPDAVLILDNSQSLYDLRNNGEKGAWADWQFFSFRKFLPLPDGALLININKKFNNKKLEHNPDYVEPWQEAAKLRYEFIHGKNNDPYKEKRYLSLFKRAGGMIHLKPQNMSELTVTLLNEFPFDEYAKIRRQNFQILNQSLINQSLVRPCFKVMNELEVPHFYAVLVANKQRDNLKAAMAEQGIFCPVHWPIWKYENSPDSLQFCTNELGFPIYQRYNANDMKFMSEVINSFEGMLER